MYILACYNNNNFYKDTGYDENKGWVSNFSTEVIFKLRPKFWVDIAMWISVGKEL